MHFRSNGFILEYTSALPEILKTTKVLHSLCFRQQFKKTDRKRKLTANHAARRAIDLAMKRKRESAASDHLYEPSTGPKKKKVSTIGRKRSKSRKVYQ